MTDIEQSLSEILAAIRAAEVRHHRKPHSVNLLAVSKTKPAPALREAYQAGQRAFGENHLQEALTKIQELDGLDIEWHFIGPVQSNKTRAIAGAFDWVHSVDRLKVATRLSDHRPTTSAPLNICVQVNISAEASKSGVPLDAAEALCRQIGQLPGLRLRGLMTIPEPETDFERQRHAFAALRRCQEQLNESGLGLDTLSMGMSGDMQAAIAEGATIVRIGTAIFGAR